MEMFNISNREIWVLRENRDFSFILNCIGESKVVLMKFSPWINFRGNFIAWFFINIFIHETTSSSFTCINFMSRLAHSARQGTSKWRKRRWKTNSTILKFYFYWKKFFSVSTNAKAVGKFLGQLLRKLNRWPCWIHPSIIATLKN